MTEDELTALGAGDAARAIRRGELRCADLTSACLARIERLNGELKAFIHVGDRCARAVATDRDMRPAAPGAPLHGIPYACKDLFHTRDMPTTAGSRVLEGWQPDHDAACVERLGDAGAVLLGKNNLHEFAYGATGENRHCGTAVNPYDRARLAGGSSSGSAAAVAARMVPFALGTDTGGSVRAPAALCGVVGFKPTRGRVSLHGVIPYCWSLDHVGILAREVADCATVLGVVAGPDPRDPHCAEQPVADYGSDRQRALEGLRIGIPNDFFFDHADPEILTATRAARDRLAALGARVCEVGIPDMTHTRDVSLTVQMPEVLSYHSRHLPHAIERYGDDLRAGLAVGQFILAESYVRALRMVARYREQMRPVFAAVDVLLTPSCPITAPAVGTASVDIDGHREPAGNAITRFTSFFNLTGHPAITLPSGLHSNGLPMGVQLVGRHFEEQRLLGVAAALEHEIGALPAPPGAA